MLFRSLRDPYLRLVHLEVSSPAAGGAGGANPFGAQFTPEEEEEFGEMARSEGFYERFAKSVAPSIFGSLGMGAQSFHRWPLTRYILRYKEIDNVSSLRRLEEDSTRWYAASRGHQCPPTR